MLKYNNEKHEYTVSGAKKVSVTKLFSSVGVKDDKGYWNSISGTEHIQGEYAAEFGKEAHKLAVLIVKGKQFDINKEARPYVKAIEMALLYIEKLIRTNNMLGDWKTSTTFFAYWRMQVAAYVQLVKENSGIVNRVETETPLYSKIYDYAGTPDFYCAKHPGKEYSTVTIRLLPNDFKVDYRKPSEVKNDFNKFLSILNTYKIGAK